MRFRITIERQGSRSILPINYQYELSAVIYRIINRANSDFSDFLHRHGYISFGKSFRLFCFSRLQFQGYKILPGTDRLEHFGRKAGFEVSFLVDRAAEEFVKGLFMNQAFVLGDKISSVNYEVMAIEALPTPFFSEVMQYRCLSPILLKKKRPDGGEDYLSPEQPEYAEIFMRNLLSKAHAFAHNGSEDFIEAGDYNLKVLSKVYKNGVKIKQHSPEATQMVGYMFEFELHAPGELQQIGFYAGFGHENSQGFGCVEGKGGGR